jgi:hypothetical protein
MSGSLVSRPNGVATWPNGHPVLRVHPVSPIDLLSIFPCQSNFDLRPNYSFSRTGWPNVQVATPFGLLAK